VFASILNMLMLFAATTNLTWYFQELHVRSSVVRTTLTWDALQTCVSDSTNMRTQNTSREVRPTVPLVAFSGAAGAALPAPNLPSHFAL